MMLVTLAVFALVLTGCNTVAGAGKDLQKAGNAISNAAEK
jgi:predicted small secreted protein